MTNIKTLKPARVKGPGNIILRYLNSLGWNQVDLAEITGVSVKTISQIINHKQAISVEMAKVLAKAFNNNPEFWLNLDNQYRLQSVNSESKENSAAIKAKIRRYMPVLEIQKNNWVQTSDNTAKGYEATFREIWGTDYNDTSVYEKSPQYAARNNKENPDYTCFYSMTWLKIAHNRAEKLSVPLYDRTKLEQIQTDFSKLTLYPDGINVLQKELKDAGVKFLYQKPLKKTYLDGACFFDGDNPVIVYTGRYDRIDHFWFTMAHEISHILLHLKKSDSEYILDNFEIEGEDEREEEANRTAGKMLYYDEIVALSRPIANYFAEKKLIEISNKVGVDPSIVLGKLQHDEIISYNSRFNHYKRKIIDQYFIPEIDRLRS